MKKIVGILAAAAVLATSVFAADVSAKVKLDGSLLNVDGTKDKGNLSAVKIGHATDEAWNPVINLATSGDNFGASVGIYVGKWQTIGTWNSGYGLGAKSWNIWFKPIDVLKFSVGCIAEGTFNETIGYSKMMSYDEWGYQVEFASNGFALNVGLHTDHDKDWLSQTVNSDDTVKTNVAGLGVKVSYSADFGTIIAYFDANDTFETINAAAGYKNQFGDLGLFFDAGIQSKKNNKIAIKNKAGNAVQTLKAGTTDQWEDVKYNFEDYFGLLADFDIKYAKDAFGIEAYAKFSMLMNYKNRVANFDVEKENGTALFFLMQATYRLDPCTIYFYFKDENLLSSTFASEIKLGLKGNVGAAAWDVAAQINTGKGGERNSLVSGSKINFSIPVSFSVGF